VSTHRRIQSTTDLLVTLWRARWGVFATAVIAAVVTAGVSMILPKSYQAEVTLMISESKLSTSNPVNTFFNPRLFNTFEGIISRREVLAESLERFPALRERDLVVDDLTQMIDVNLVSNSRLLRLSIELFDAQLAADVANQIAHSAADYSMRELQTSEAEAIRGRLAPELAAAEQALGEAEVQMAQALAAGSVSALENYHANVESARNRTLSLRAPFAAQLEAQRLEQADEMPLEMRVTQVREGLIEFNQAQSPEDLRARQGDLLNQRREFSQRVSRLDAELAQSRGELEALGDTPSATSERLIREIGGLEAEAAQSRTILESIERSAEEVIDQLARAELEGRDRENELERLWEEQSLLYDYSTPTLEALVAGYDGEIASLGAEGERLRALIGQVETQQVTAKAQLEVAQEALTSLQTAHAEVAMRMEEKHQGLVVIDEAIAPFYPESPRKRLLTLLAGGLAFFLACVFVIARENMLASLEESGQA
jgi:capsular polysaccharide biosynthesis protein